MDLTMKKNNNLLLILILLSVVLGLFTGLFFGERCRHLAIIGNAFIAIMQISVLPYILVSLVQSIGSLEPMQARSVAKRGVILIVAMWGIVFFLMSLMPLCFPLWKSATFFTPSLLDTRETVDYIQLFIPANPFNSLANNVVPAVTIFSILCGVVLMSVPKKENLLNLLEVTSEVLANLTLMLVRLSPIGIFALIANAAGTMYPADILRLEVYLISYLVMGGLLFFLIMPLILTMFTHFRYLEIMRISRTAMLTVLLTGNLFIVLPLLVENIKKLFQQHHLESEESDNMAKIIVPITFIVPCAGQLMDLLFVLFAAWFRNQSLGISGYLELYGAGLLTQFGSSKVAIPFLLSMFKLPSDLFQLFVVASVITDNVKFAVEAFAIFVLSAFFTAWMIGKVRWKLHEAMSRLIFIAIGTALSLWALNIGFRCLLRNPSDERHTLDCMKINQPVESVVFDKLPDKHFPAGNNRLQAIRKSGVLRVGYNSNVMPFAFFNNRRQLLGFDIEMAGMLAHELGCKKVEFYPVSYDNLAAPLNNNQVDIIMSEVSITEKRLGTMSFSRHYLELSMALVVPDYVKEKLLEDPNFADSRDFTIAAMDGADFDRLRQMGLKGKQVSLKNYEDFFRGKVKADALLMTAEKGSAWTILYPDYALFIPEKQYKDLIAYALPQDDILFLEYVNFWLTLKKINGDIDRLYEYWIRGVNVTQRLPRWCILDNVILKEN